MKEQEDKQIKLLKWVVFFVICLLIIGLGLAILYKDDIQQIVDKRHNIMQINETGYCVDECINYYMQNVSAMDCVTELNQSFWETCESNVNINCSMADEALQTTIIPYCFDFMDNYLYNVSIFCTRECNNGS